MYTIHNYYTKCFQLFKKRFHVLGILDAFAQFWRGTISFVVSVRPSVCLHGTIRLLREWLLLNFCIWGFFREFVEKIQVLLKSKKNAYLTFMIISRSVPLKVKNISGKICRKNQNWDFMFNNFFVPIILPFRDDVEKYGRMRQATNYNIVLYRKDVICVLPN